MCCVVWFFFFQAEDGIRDLVRSRGLGDVYKRQRLVSGSGSVETKSLSSGVYFLKVFSGEKIIHVQKLVKVD